MIFFNVVTQVLHYLTWEEPGIGNILSDLFPAHNFLPGLNVWEGISPNISHFWFLTGETIESFDEMLHLVGNSIIHLQYCDKMWCMYTVHTYKNGLK